MIRSALLCLSLLMPLAAQNFRTQRNVHPAGKGPQRLAVDLQLLGGCRSDLGDLRLKDAAGHEVPYVLVPPMPGEPQWKSGRMLPLPQTKESSGFEMDLGEGASTGRLRVEGLRAPFLKRFRLEGSGDRQRWTVLVREGSLFDLPAEGLQLLNVDFPSGEYRYLRLVWDDRSSARMALPRNASILVEGSGGGVPPQEILSFEARPSEPGSSRYRVRLPGPRLPIRALLLDVGGQGPLHREATIMEGRLEANSMTPRILGRGTLRRAEREGLQAADLRIPMDNLDGAELDIKVNNGNNPPLSLKGLKAEVESQPWIYFESPDGGIISANYGDAKLAAPKYDLEALKEQLRTAKPVRAKWEAPQPAMEEVARYSASLDPGPGAPLDRKGFRFQRPVPAMDPGMAALVLDVHVLSHSPSLSGLRLLDTENRQIPYLLERRDEPIVLALQLPKGLLKGKLSTYTLSLPQAQMPASCLLLGTDARVFRRLIRVRQDQGQGQLQTLEEAIWQHGDPAEGASPLRLELPALEGRSLVLEVEEGDNQPLAIKEAQLLLPTWRLRFFRPSGELALCYGSVLEEPRYDLALLAERLRLEPARELALGQEGATAPEPDRAPQFTKLFWGVLVAAVIALVLMLMRLLKQPQKTDTES